MLNRGRNIEKGRVITRRMFILAAAKILLLLVYLQGYIIYKFLIEKSMKFYLIKIGYVNGKLLLREV